MILNRTSLLRDHFPKAITFNKRKRYIRWIGAVEVVDIVATVVVEGVVVTAVVTAKYNYLCLKKLRRIS